MTELDAITAIGLGTVADCHRDKLITSQIGRRAAKGRILPVSRRAMNDSNQPSTATETQKPAFSHFSNSTPAQKKLRHGTRRGKAQHHPTQIHRTLVRHQPHQVAGGGPGELLHQARHRSG